MVHPKFSYHWQVLAKDAPQLTATYLHPSFFHQNELQPIKKDSLDKNLWVKEYTKDQVGYYQRRK